MADLMVKGLAGLTPEGTGVNPARKDTRDAEPVFASLIINAGSVASQKTNEAKNTLMTQTGPTERNLTSDTYKDRIVKEAPAAKGDGIITDETKDQLQMYNDKIKEAVMEEYNISEEELEEVMQVLGLDFIQLLIPENLVKLSVEITGAADSLELLSNDGFNNLFGMMQEIGAELQAEPTLELDITPETINLLAETLSEEPTLPNMEEAERPVVNEEATLNLPEENVDSTNVSEITRKEAPEAAPEIIIEDTKTESKETIGLAEKIEAVVTEGIQKGTVEVQVTKPAEEAPMAETEEVDVQDQSITLNGVAGDVEETPDKNFPNNSQTDHKDNFERSDRKEKTTVESQMASNVAAPTHNFRDVAIEKTVTAPTMPQVDAQDIIRQINDYMKLTINGSDASLEMQLNPESLGKVALNISLKEGMVTAQLAVQNETVKQALESQMVILRENMNNQGLKVEAVEVTIASHEFEQNLENGFTGQEQPQEGNQQTGRRNLVASDLNLSMDDLDDGEKLAARIMVDNGNSMDVTA